MGNLEQWEPSELTCAQQENAAYAFRGARLLLPQGLTALRCPFLDRFDCRCAARIPLEDTCRTRALHRTRAQQISLDDKLELRNANLQMQMLDRQPSICNPKSRLQNLPWPSTTNTTKPIDEKDSILP